MEKNMVNQKQFIESKIEQFDKNLDDWLILSHPYRENSQKLFLSTALKEIVEETRDEIGREIVNISNYNNDGDEKMINDILNYACRLKKNV